MELTEDERRVAIALARALRWVVGLVAEEVSRTVHSDDLIRSASETREGDPS